MNGWTDVAGDVADAAGDTVSATGVGRITAKAGFEYVKGVTTLAQSGMSVSEAMRTANEAIVEGVKKE